MCLQSNGVVMDPYAGPSGGNWILGAAATVTILILLFLFAGGKLI